MHARISQYGVFLGSRHLLNVWKKNCVNISKTVQERDTVAMED